MRGKVLTFLGMASACLAVIAVFVYADIYFRGRTAFFNAERHFGYYLDPGKKLTDLKAELSEKEKLIEERFSKGDMPEEEYELQKILIKGEFKRQMEDSSLKNALMWYETVPDLFSPPDTRWVRAAKAKIPECRRLYMDELRARGVDVEDFVIGSE